MEKIVLHLMGAAYRPHGQPVEEVPYIPGQTVYQALITCGYPEKGVKFLLAQKNKQVIQLDSQLSAGDEIFIYMPVGGG